MSRPFIPAFLLLLGSTVLGATVLQEPLADAARLAQGVVITNTPEQAVPVREQNLDNGSIRVHEQGTISVRPVVPANPWHRVRIVNVGNRPFLTEEPSGSPINITSLTVAGNGVGGVPAGATAFLEAVTVPATATDCSGEATGDTLWASTMVA